MSGGMNSEMIEAAIMSQLRNNTCCALPTWFEDINSTICVGITSGNNADDCALRPNHRVLRINCPRSESLEIFTSLPNPFATHSLSFIEYITSSLAIIFLIQVSPNQRLLQHILDMPFSSKNFLESRYKHLQHTYLHFYHQKIPSTFTFCCLVLRTTTVSVILLRKKTINFLHYKRGNLW